MATNTFTFICAIHEEYGTKGWKLKSMPHFEPLTGPAIPHDMLEHFSDDNGTAADECQALGASLWIRGEAYYKGIKGSYHTPASNAGSDIAELWRKGLSMCKAPRVTRLDDADMEADLIKARAEIIHTIKCEIKDQGCGEETLQAAAERYVDNALAWMRKGYKRAKAKYKGILQDTLASWFHAIEVECDQLLANADEGQEMVVILDMRNCHADCSLVEAEYADY